MRTIYFVNKEPIDLGAIAIMGVSVKEGSNPIGYFGTGLKFALATLLRTGHEVTLNINGDHQTHLGPPAGHVNVTFEARPEVIRGETFQRVYMVFSGGASQPLGFTTALGRNWEPWMAYRELRSNAMDEGGFVTTDRVGETWKEDYGTVFAVTGDALATCHDNAAEIFLSTAPLWKHPEVSIHPGSNRHAFYRGVRAHEYAGGTSSLFTYNLLHPCTLTEDRTLKSAWDLQYHAAQSVAACENEDIVYPILMADKGTFEHGLNYDGMVSLRPSTTFMTVCERMRRNARLNLSALKLWERFTDVRTAYETAALNAFEEGQVGAALRLVRRLMPDASRKDFLVLDGMGSDIYGLHRHGHTFVSRRAIDKGVRFLASTIYEELLHSKDGMVDESRDTQNFLFDKLFMVVEQLAHMEPEPPEEVGRPDPGERVRLMQESTGMTPQQARELGVEVNLDDQIPF